MEAIETLEPSTRRGGQGPRMAVGYQLLEPDFSDLDPEGTVIVYVF